jgi:glycosyltransferase involved in cell wall biosynthesis
MPDNRPAGCPPSAGVSVIIPSHNRPALLQDALSSVLDQTLPPAEIIVVDDASSPPVSLPASRNGIPLKLLRHEQARGGAAAKNTGVQAARGELIAFLDDDDLWAPTYLEHATALLAQHAEIDVLFMGVDWFGKSAGFGQQNYQQAMNKVLSEADGKQLGPGVQSFGHRLVKALLQRVPMAFQRPVVRRTAFHRIGGYQEHCLLWDCDWALRAALDSKVALSEAPLYRQRVDSQGYSSRPTREREQTQSNIEIRERLAASLTAKDAATRLLRHDFKRSASEHWFHLAYQLQRQGESRAAFKAWMASRQMAPQPRSMNLLLRILFNIRNRS